MTDNAAKRVVHHRVVLAIETSAAAVAYFPLFRRLALHHLNEILFNRSFEAAVITFSPHGGTARSCQTVTPWTADFTTLVAWVDAVPALMEGSGPVAAFEAISEALSMFEWSSEHTPRAAAAAATTAAPPQQGHAPGHRVQPELLMLWLSEAHASYNVLVRPPGVPTIQAPQLLATLFLRPPTVSFVVLAPATGGARRSILRMEHECAHHMPKVPGVDGGIAFAAVPCSAVPAAQLLALVPTLSGALRAFVSRVKGVAAADEALQERLAVIFSGARSAQHGRGKDADERALRTARGGGGAAGSEAQATPPASPPPAQSPPVGAAAGGAGDAPRWPPLPLPAASEWPPQLLTPPPSPGPPSSPSPHSQPPYPLPPPAAPTPTPTAHHQQQPQRPRQLEPLIPPPSAGPEPVNRFAWSGSVVTVAGGAGGGSRLLIQRLTLFIHDTAGLVPATLPSPASWPPALEHAGYLPQSAAQATLHAVGRVRVARLQGEPIQDVPQQQLFGTHSVAVLASRAADVAAIVLMRKGILAGVYLRLSQLMQHAQPTPRQDPG